MEVATKKSLEDDKLLAAKLAAWQDPQVLHEVLKIRVGKGAKLLDERIPDWPIKVSLEDFSHGKDFLQQLFDDHIKAAEILGVENQESYYGFFPPMIDQWSELKEVWKEVIQDRLMKMSWSCLTGKTGTKRRKS